MAETQIYRFYDWSSRSRVSFHPTAASIWRDVGIFSNGVSLTTHNHRADIVLGDSGIISSDTLS
jgi:hypothetical protein